MEHDPLRQLRETPVAPAGLEARVVATLRDAGLIRTRRRSSLIRVAAAAAVFTVGVAAGRWTADVGSTAPAVRTMPSYLLLLGGDARPSADGSNRAAEYGTWARAIKARGGAELVDGGRVLAGMAGEPAMRPLVEAGGYFIIDAESDEAAAAIAKTCPHVAYGGSIVVRRLSGP